MFQKMYAMTQQRHRAPSRGSQVNKMMAHMVNNKRARPDDAADYGFEFDAAHSMAAANNAANVAALAAALPLPALMPQPKDDLVPQAQPMSQIQLFRYHHPPLTPRVLPSHGYQGAGPLSCSCCCLAMVLCACAGC